MKPTSEERREVARRLRDEGLYASLMPRDQFFRWMFDVVDSPKTVASMTMHLADLIEPDPERTCRVLTEKRTVSQTQETHIKSCSACGYMFGAEKHCQLLPGLDEEFVLDDVQIPSFCPNCGAKVEGAAK